VNPTNILVFRIGHLGDTIVSLPALWQIRRSFPAARMTLLSNADSSNPDYVSAHAVLPKSGLFDSWITYPNGLSRIGSLTGHLGLFKTIRKGRFDMLVYLMTRNRTPKRVRRDILFFRLAGIRDIRGHNYLIHNWLEEHATKDAAPVISESEFLLKCLDNEGINPQEPEFCSDLLLEDDEVSFADYWLKTTAGSGLGDRRFVAVGPGSKWDSKVWSEDRYSAVVKRLIADHDVFPIVFGGPEDRKKGDRLVEQWSLGANAAGAFTVRQSAAALSKCVLYVGNDTGTMHLAAAVNTPCVAIFSAIDWVGRWHPFGSGHRVLRKRVECEGCHSPICKTDRRCLTLIGVEEVVESCKAVLAKTVKATPVMYSQ